MLSGYQYMTSLSYEKNTNSEEIIENMLKNTCEENAAKTPTSIENNNISEQLHQIDLSVDGEWIIFVGLPNSGKTSILCSLFKNITGYDCFFLKSTTQIEYHCICNSGFMQYNILDIPGYVNIVDEINDFIEIIKRAHTIIFVINIQSEHATAINYLINIMQKIPIYNSRIYYEIFLHKIDSIPSKYRVGKKFHKVMRKIFVDIVGNQGIHDNFIRYHYTTIFDYTIFAAFSKICQHLTKNIDYLDCVLNTTKTACKMEKIFLVDVNTKIVVASDTYATSADMYQLCFDIIEIAKDFCEFFNVKLTDESCDPIQKYLSPNPYLNNVFKGDRHNFMTLSLANDHLIYVLEIAPYLVAFMYLPKNVAKKTAVFRHNINCFYNTVIQFLSPRRIHHPYAYVTPTVASSNHRNTSKNKFIVIKHIDNLVNNDQDDDFSSSSPQKSDPKRNSVINCLSIGYKFY